MSPNDVLARIVEAWINDDLIGFEEFLKMADAMEDAGRAEEARLMRQRDRPLCVHTDINDRWYLIESVMLPSEFRKTGIKVRMGDEGWPCNASQ